MFLSYSFKSWIYLKQDFKTGYKKGKINYKKRSRKIHLKKAAKHNVPSFLSNVLEYISKLYLSLKFWNLR